MGGDLNQAVSIEETDTAWLLRTICYLHSCLLSTKPSTTRLGTKLGR